MDNPNQEPSNALDENSAVDAFASILGLTEPQKEETEEQKLEKLAAEEVKDETPEPEAEPEPEDNAPITVEVDGKKVELTKEQIAEAYKNGLRQADYTRKTMEVSEQRKAAEAETQKALAERNAYGVNLQKMQAQLEGALQEQQKVDWNALLESDPVEYLKQQHLFQQRQAAYQQNMQQQDVLRSQYQAEQQKAQEAYVRTQREELLAKLPDWKDKQKADAEKGALREYLIKEGYDEQSVDNVADARAVVLARKAMLYDQMIAKARTAAKKVSSLPQKVERPGNGEQSMDKRSAAFQRLSKSGSVDDAAAVFRQFV